MRLAVDLGSWCSASTSIVTDLGSRYSTSTLMVVDLGSLCSASTLNAGWWNIDGRTTAPGDLAGTLTGMAFERVGPELSLGRLAL
jgi:hypothetical protein